MSHQVTQGVDVKSYSDIIGQRTPLHNVGFILDACPAHTYPLLNRQPSASSPVPAPRLDGEGVGAEAQAGPGDAFSLVDGVWSSGVDVVDGARGVDLLVDGESRRCMIGIDLGGYSLFADPDIVEVFIE